MKLIKKLVKFDKVIENIRKEQEEDEKKRLAYIEQHPEKAAALEKDKSEEDDMLEGARKIGLKETFRQLWFLFGGIRRQLPKIFILMIANSVIGLFSMALIVPFFLLLQEHEIIGTHYDTSGEKFFKKVIIDGSQFFYDILEPVYTKYGLYETLGISPSVALVILFGLIFLFMFVFKTALGLYLNYRFALYGAMATRHFSGRMFSVLLYISYTYYLGRSAHRTMYALELAGKCYGVIVGLFATINDLLLMLLLGLGIMLYDMRIIFILGIIFLITFFVYRLSHLELKRLAEIELHLGRKSSQNTYQGIHNFTFSRLFHAEPFFMQIFNKFVDYNIPIGAYKGIVTGLPRITTEILTMVAFVGAGMFIIITNPTGLADLFTAAVFLAGVTIKLMPIALRLTGYLGTLAGDQISVDEFYKEYTTASDHVVDQGEHEHVAPLTFEKSIEIKKLSFAYPEFDKKGITYSYEFSPFVLKNISFSIKKGEKIGIIGTSGGGKTTFMNLLMAFLEPAKGDILVDGVSVFKEMRSWHKNIGYVPQDTMLMSATVLENIAFGQDVDDIDEKKVEKSLKSAHLWDVVEAMPKGMKTFIGDSGKRLSGGQRQRLGIARALYRDPSVILLDEATSHLDQATEKEVQKAIDDIDISKTVIIVAHRLNTLKKCDRIYAFDKGKIAFVGVYEDMIKKYG